MMLVHRRPETTNFDTLVRQPGIAFLRTKPVPTKKDWDRNRYWRYISNELYSAYNSTCAYLGEWIPTPGSIDHFIPKTVNPSLAYEWDNYRLSSQKMNNNKGSNVNIVDPFLVRPGGFILDLPSCLIHAGPGLSTIETQLIQNTIDILKLNDDDNLVQNRCNILVFYSQGDLSITFLRKRYPYIASELERQGIVETVKTMFRPLIRSTP